jgi:hypothetical protein
MFERMTHVPRDSRIELDGAPMPNCPREKIGGYFFGGAVEEGQWNPTG